jgi:hypothetical protein
MSANTESLIANARKVNVDAIMQKVDAFVSDKYVMPDVKHLFPKLDVESRTFREDIGQFLFHAANYKKHKDDRMFTSTIKHWERDDSIGTYVGVCIKHEFKSPEIIAHETRRILELAKILKQDGCGEDVGEVKAGDPRDDMTQNVMRDDNDGHDFVDGMPSFPGVLVSAEAPSKTKDARKKNKSHAK